MKTLRVVGLVAFIGAVCVRLLASEPDAQLGLPADLAKYKDWPRLLEAPVKVPIEFWFMCMSPSEAARAAARQTYGPHSERLIMVYGNALAYGAVSATAKRVFPPGAVVVKEKLTKFEGGTADGLGFMIKHQSPAFAESGGWEFRYFPAGDVPGTQESCAACHRGAAAKDYVFGSYPR